MSLNFMLKTERGNVTPKITTNSRSKINGKRKIVDVGINWKITRKIPKTAISKVTIINEVILALIAGISLGMYI